MPTAPAILPTYTNDQARSSAPNVMRRLAMATIISESPVNSSAPPTITRISPSEKTMPARRRATPQGSSPAPVNTTVMKIAPNAMKAPASSPKMMRQHIAPRLGDTSSLAGERHLRRQQRIDGACARDLLGRLGHFSTTQCEANSSDRSTIPITFGHSKCRLDFCAVAIFTGRTKTEKAIGLTVRSTLFARADGVIE